MPRKQPAPLTGNQRRRIRMMAPHRPIREIAEAIGESAQRVRRFIYREGIEFVAERGILNDVDIVNEVAREGSMTAVAEIYGVSKQAVFKKLKDALEECDGFD